MSDTVVLERVSGLVRKNHMPAGSIRRQRVYILPSRQGLIYSILLVTLLLGAINYNNSMAYLFTFLLASLLMVCMLYTYRNLAGLIISTEPAKPVFAGEVAYFPLVFDNRHAGEKPALELAPAQAGFLRRAAIRPPLVTQMHIQADQLVRCQFPVKTRQRGLVSAGRITVSSRYPLGLFRAWSNIHNTRQCLVYPEPAGNLPLQETAVTSSLGEGGGKAGADDFVGFRHYRPGDSVRNIAWKALAREQALLVKRFSGERGVRLILSWQQVVVLGQTEAKLSQLCKWILEAEAGGYYYGLEIPGTLIEPACGNTHRNACLEALARFGLKDD